MPPRDPTSERRSRIRRLLAAAASAIVAGAAVLLWFHFHEPAQPAVVPTPRAPARFEPATSGTFTAVVFTIWTLFAGSCDSFLKPILLGRGAKVPMLIVFIGAIGGFMTQGIIGLFVGAVVFSLGYQIFMAWLQIEAGPMPEEDETRISIPGDAVEAKQ